MAEILHDVYSAMELMRLKRPVEFCFGDYDVEQWLPAYSISISEDGIGWVALRVMVEDNHVPHYEYVRVQVRRLDNFREAPRVSAGQ